MPPEIKDINIHLRSLERMKERQKWNKKWPHTRSNTITTNFQKVLHFYSLTSPQIWFCKSLLLCNAFWLKWADRTNLCNHCFAWFQQKKYTTSNTQCIAVTSHWEWYIISHEEKLTFTELSVAKETKRNWRCECHLPITIPFPW